MSNETAGGVSLPDFLSELNAGIFAKKIERALADIALGTVTYGDKGKTGNVTVKFDFKRLGESDQLVVHHSLIYSKPTMRGKAGEEDHTETALYVGVGGKLTLLPDKQLPMFEDSKSDA